MKYMIDSVLHGLLPLRMAVASLSTSHASQKTISPSIDASDRINWGSWLSRFVHMEVQQDTIYLPHDFVCEADLSKQYPDFVSTTITTQIIELDDIFGLDSSRSDLSKFTDITEFARQVSSELLDDDVDSLLNWPELSIFGEHCKDFVSVYAWDKRKFLMQGGGSHHFSAACYRARHLGEKRTINLRVEELSLNQDAIYKLLNDVSLLHSNNICDTGKVIDALHKEKIPFALHSSPYKYSPGTTFVIPKSKSRYQNASKLLANRLEDIGQKLKLLIELQLP